MVGKALPGADQGGAGVAGWGEDPAEPTGAQECQVQFVRLRPTSVVGLT